MMNRKDKQEVDSFHAVSSGLGRPTQNLRDASGSSQSHARPGAWGNNPGQSIPLPSQQRQPRANHPANPYGLDRMKDNITKLPYGNRTARQTIVPSRRDPDPFVDGPPSKRPRTAYSSYAIPNTATGPRGHRVSQRANNKPVSRTIPPSNMEVNVIDDDEDIGVHINRQEEPISSPDPLRLGSNPMKSSIVPDINRASHSGVHPFDADNHSTLGRPHIKESNVVQQLRVRDLERKRKHEINEVPDSESDGIEEFGDDVKASSSKQRQSTTQQRNQGVRSKINFFETKKVPHMDFSSSAKRPRQNRSIAGSMKSKSNVPQRPEKSKLDRLHFMEHIISNQGFDDPDTLSAPSLSAPKSTKNARAERDGTTLKLPLEAWFWGLKVYPEQDDIRDFLCWDGKTSVTIRRRLPGLQQLQNLVNITVNSQVDDVQVTNDVPNLPENIVIQLRSRKYTRKSGTFVGSGQFCEPGSQSSGLLTFKFLKNDPEWDDSRYQRLVAFLRKQVPPHNFSTTRGNGANAIWSNAQEAARLEQREIDPQDFEATQAGKHSVQPDVTPTAVSRPKPRPAYKGANDGIVDMPESKSVRRSSRQPPSRKSASTDPDELILVYPPSGNGAINITQGDLNRLEDGEYLNDTLIEFGLKLWLNNIRAKNPELADQIHVFSSFFYKKLKSNTKNPEEGYQSVRKWTQKFDLFQKQYLIVPINEHLHWYLAIIYQPEHVLLPPPPIVSASVSTRTRKNQSAIVEQSSTTPNRSPPPGHRMEDGSASLPPSPSAIGNDGEVEEMFGRSCSISVDDSKLTSTTTSSAGDQVDREAPEADSIVVDDDGVLHELQYPSPDTSTSRMDVDELAGDEAMEEGTAHGISITSSKPLSTDTSSRAKSEKTRSVSSTSGAVRANSFYSSTKEKEKEKEKERAGSGPRPFPLDVVDVSCSDDGEQDEVDDLLNEADSSVQPEQPRTYIFTLDSLGSKHPQAIKFLRRYLKMEAKDKKNIINSSDAKGLQALVPFQPNFCDCGLYLLHLAKTFLNRPDHHRQIILSRSKKSLVERQMEWDDVDARDSRKKFKSQVEELSQAWKKEYAVLQAQKGKNGDKQESSDSEVDIVEDTTQNAKSAPSKKTKAARIRG